MSQIHPIRGLAAGLLAGCAASWVMNHFQQMQPLNPPPKLKNGKVSMPQRKGDEESMHQGDDLDENATVKTAQRISQKVFQHELTDVEKRLAGPAVHYAYGSLVGALYGGLAEFLPGVSAGAGLPFGFALWLLG